MFLSAYNSYFKNRSPFKKSRFKKKHFKRRFFRNSTPSPKLYIRSNSKTLFFTLLDSTGRVLATLTPGMFSLKGPDRITTVSIDAMGKRAALKIKQFGYNSIVLMLQMRNNFLITTLVKVLTRSGVKISRIEEDLLVAHNGCRTKKIRRV
jgi:ribosomal protein S11